MKRTPPNTPVALNDAKLRRLRPRERPYKLYDAGRTGLHVLITPGGSILFRLRYWFEGRERTLAIGRYPVIGLAKARERALEAKALVADGVDPVLQRKAAKTVQAAATTTFASIAREWHTRFGLAWTERHRLRTWARIEQNLLPWLGVRPIGEITAAELLATLRRMEARGAVSLAHRCQGYASAIFRYATATGRAESDPSAALRGALPAAPARHFSALSTPAEVGELLRAIDSFEGTFVVQCALRLAPLVFVRPTELRAAEWSEINLDAGEWRIPPARMKMKDAHLVPLSSQAVAILRELHPLTGSGRYVFPSVRGDARPMSENTINVALRRLGYSKEQMTGHGFRSIASTLLNELGYPGDVVELQLAHRERNQVRAAYNRAEHLPERRAMMQSWADYLDGLRAGGKVLAFRSERHAR